MKKIITFITVVITIISIQSCNDCKSNCKRHPEDRVLDSITTSKLSPDVVKEILIQGNHCFQNSDYSIRDHSQKVIDSIGRQFPKAVILSCLDSRIPIEDVFERRVGDVFVARVAGNFANEDILGSMEFAVSTSKLILVVGHEDCGAIKGAIDIEHIPQGNLHAMLEKIRPAVDSVKGFSPSERTSSNPKFVHAVCESNVKNTIAYIHKNSGVLDSLAKNKNIKIIGGIYNMKSGKVTFLDE